MQGEKNKDMKGAQVCVKQNGGMGLHPIASTKGLGANSYCCGPTRTQTEVVVLP